MKLNFTKMFPQFLIRITFLLLLLLLTIVESRMTLPNCEQHCGNISIPYPFGITTKCSMNQWFEIICNTKQRPFVKSINAELLRVLPLDGYDDNSRISFEVKGPIISSNCTNSGNITSSSLNLSNSPFTISGDNTFIAIGCNTRATMSQIYPEIVGCESTCSGRNITVLDYASDGCNGTNCCQTTIPRALQVFDVTLERRNTSIISQDECQLAFLASQTWLQSDESDLSSVRNMDYVTLVLQWEIFVPTSDDSRAVICDNVVTTTGLRHSNYSVCRCGWGYEGNPYLPNGDGCEDIDECQRNENTCYSGAKCVNTIGNYDCKEDRSWIVILATCLGVGVFFALIAIWRLYKFMKRRKQIKLKKKFFKRNGGLLLQQQLCSDEQGTIDKMKVFSAKELEAATDNYNDNRILGQGGQGTVYKGMLVDGKIVAVKKSKLVDEEKLDEFINEVVILSQINHRNVVKLLGCCLETNVPLLVYEFIPNGNLFRYIHAQKDETLMSWAMRLRIASEVAGALSYLHSSAAIPIYHRDIKSTNILLDEKCRAKVSDFGTSRSISIDQTHLTTNVAGTFGYFDPEYFQSSQFTDKSDVYSFGVVLVELLTGQKPISFARSEHCRSLATHFLLTMEENLLSEIIDPHIKRECGEESLAFADLAKKCLYLNGKFRPSMKEVSRELDRIIGFSRKDSKLEKHFGDIRQFVETDMLLSSSPWEFNSSTATSSGICSSSVKDP